MDENENKVVSEYKSFVGVKFYNGARAYFFGVRDDEKYVMDDYVVVETVRGVELGQIAIEPVDIKNYQSELGLKPVLRRASDVDIKIHQSNLKDAKTAMEICEVEIKRLGLDMNLISCEYTLDKSRVIFSFVSDDRVDFRELLKSLASKLRTRIELRQIGTRDKAKMVGGIGICGLPLCCSSFLNEFDGISISRAKNQMLAINIPKLSGHCGKLICCLKYEDDAYTELKKDFPEIGTHVWIDKKEYVITSYNVISSIVKIEGEEDDIQFVTLEELKKHGTFRKKNRNNDKE